jgi:thioredoxin reductase
VTLEPVAAQVTLIHRSRFRAHEATVRQLEESTVDINYPGCEITAIHAGDDGHLSAITFKNAEGDERTIPADDLIVAIGFVADLGPMKTWGFELQRNQIVVDKITMETGLPGVFGAGDVVTYPAKFKLIVTGAAEAVTAINHAVTFYDPKARLDPGHSTNIMEKREKAEAAAEG